MTTVADLRHDLELAAAEVARLRAFLAAIEEMAADGLADQPWARPLALLAIHSLARDAADPTAPVPGRVAQLWNEQVEGL